LIIEIIFIDIFETLRTQSDLFFINSSEITNNPNSFTCETNKQFGFGRKANPHSDF